MSLDTVKLHISDYSISSQSNLKIQPGTFNIGTGELTNDNVLVRDSAGKIYHGARAYLNTAKIHFDVKPFHSNGQSTTSAFVHFSVPKLHNNGVNYKPVSEAQVRDAFGMVEQELQENGINTDIREANLSRVDTFRNVEPREPFIAYFALLDLLKARRGVKRSYGTTYLLGNSQQEFCVYDKNVEMAKHGVDLRGFPENTMRFEHRLLNKRKVQTTYGFTNVNDLLHGGLEVVEQKRRQAWSNSLFRYEVTDVIRLGAASLEAEMRAFQAKYDKRWYNNFLRCYGAYHLASLVGVEVVKLALQSVEVDRRQVWRAQRMLEDSKQEIEFFRQEQESRRTLADLYQELKNKVLN